MADFNNTLYDTKKLDKAAVLKLEMWVLIASYRRAIKEFTNVKELYEDVDRAEEKFKENTTRGDKDASIS
jgi:hypothetical protein